MNTYRVTLGSLTRYNPKVVIVIADSENEARDLAWEGEPEYRMCQATVELIPEEEL